MSATPEPDFRPRPRTLWLDTKGEPVVTSSVNGERNARRWGWTPAVARPLDPLAVPGSRVAWGVRFMNGRVEECVTRERAERLIARMDLEPGLALVSRTVTDWIEVSR